MKKAFVRIINLILVIAMIGLMTIPSEATTVKDIQDQINQDNAALNEINDDMLALQDEQDLLEEEICDLDAELINTMTVIGGLEEDIAASEEAIAAKKQDITAKEADIRTTQRLYEEAREKEEEQYNAMVARIQYLYENGEGDYLSVLFSATSFSEILTLQSYIEAVYAYDQNMLAAYEAAREEVKLLWERLEEEKASLEEEKAALEAEKASLEANRAEMEAQVSYLDGLLARKKQESANYEAQIARMRQEANALKVKIRQEQAELKKMEEEARRRAAAAVANGSYTVSASISDIINGASGSDLGKQIARYGCQYIGNPYVSGGTSLTNGADCSGFTYRIYSNFGYTIPRTSYQQRSAGTEVSYENAQPGDLICYEGHVAMYIGGGYIVHASNVKTGIKVSRATYKKILTVRRII